jgi:iron complex outermembrane receptor protein
MNRQILAASTAAIALLAAGATSAQAQTAPEHDDPAITVDEVVVTARKTTERLQDVPISVNVTSGETLERQNIKDFRDLSSYIPNFYVQQSVAAPSLFIRGIGSNVNNLAFEQSVGLFVDGEFRGRAKQSQTAFLDVDRVEVLRGPQGALFGKNTSSGALNITTRNPGETFEAEAYTIVNVEGDRGLEGGFVLSGPVTDQLGVRLAAKANENNGWFSNATTGNDEPHRSQQQARLTVEYEPTDELLFRLKADGYRHDDKGAPFFTAPYGATRTYDRATTPGQPEYDRGKGIDFALTTIYSPANGYVFTSITSRSAFDYVRLADTDFLTPRLLATEYGEDYTAYAQEIRVTSPKIGRFDFTAGAYAQHAESDFRTISTLTLAPFDGAAGRFMHQEGTAYSIYAQGGFDLTESLKLTVGVRQSWEDKEATQHRVLTGVQPASYLSTTLTGQLDESSFDPSAQLQYRFTPNAMVYVSYAKGSKAGGFVHGQTNGVQSNFVFQGETSKSAEIGGKFELLNRRLRINVAGFDTSYDNLQVSAWDPTANVTVTRNAATATSRGVELEANARLTRALTLNGSFAYTEAKYDDFPGAGCLYGVPVTPTGPCTSAGQNIGGTFIPRVPKTSGSVSLVYDETLNNDLAFRASAVAAYRSAYDLDDNLNPFARQDGYTKFDLTASLGSLDGGWEVALIGRNLTNEITSAYALGTPFVAGHESISLDAGRTIGIQFRMRR